MPKARARLAPTTSMMTAPTTARMICVWTTAGVRGGVPRRFGRSASAAPSSGRQRQPDQRVPDLVHRMRAERLVLRRLVDAVGLRGAARCVRDRRRAQAAISSSATRRANAAASNRTCSSVLQRQPLIDLLLHAADEPVGDRPA